MDIRPIVSSLRKHRMPALLIVLEITLACAVMCNAVFLISQRISSMHLPNGIDAQGISVISVDGTDPKLVADSIPRNLAALRGIAGVYAVADVNTLPLSRSGFGTAVYPTAARKHSKYVTQYLMTSRGEKAFGLHLLRGRFFTDQEYAASELSKGYEATGHVAIVTRSFAHKLWPGQSAVGKVLYAISDSSYIVVGVVADVLPPRLSSSKERDNYDNVFFPMKPVADLDSYIVRSAPGHRQDVLRRAEKVLARLEPAAVIKGQTYTKMRDTYFANATSMIWILVLVCIVMLGVTAFGIVGLTSFWVTQRRAQIGIRRALGARKRDIRSYFQTENFLLVTAGVALGMALAWTINIYLMHHYELARMPWCYLPVGAVTLWLLGQLAVLAPALRAANVPPALATRTV